MENTEVSSSLFGSVNTKQARIWESDPVTEFQNSVEVVEAKAEE